MNKKIQYLFFILLFLILVSFKNDKPAYKIYNSKGKAVSYEDMLKAAKEADVVFFGEEHSNPICHWLELELAKDLYELKKEKFALGMEMLETDNQLLLNEYLDKLIRKKDFESEAKLWKNYPTDYAPIVDFAREKGIHLIATNIPRRYAALVNLKGFEGLDSLNAAERGLVAPLRIKFNPELGCYKNMLSAMGGDPGAMHSMANLPKAQAIKDATMAWFIFKNMPIEGMTFLHYNGSYHSENHEGIVWYLNEYNKRTATTLKIITISVSEQANISKLDTASLGKADFILCIPESMPKSHESFISPPMPPPAAKSPAMPPKPEVKKHDSLPPASSSDDDGGGDDDD